MPVQPATVPLDQEAVKQWGSTSGESGIRVVNLTRVPHRLAMASARQHSTQGGCSSVSQICVSGESMARVDAVGRRVPSQWERYRSCLPSPTTKAVYQYVRGGHGVSRGSSTAHGSSSAPNLAYFSMLCWAVAQAVCSLQGKARHCIVSAFSWDGFRCLALATCFILLPSLPSLKPRQRRLLASAAQQGPHRRPEALADTCALPPQGRQS